MRAGSATFWPSPGTGTWSMRPSRCEPCTICRQPFARGGTVERDLAAGEMREDAAVVVPVAVVLVPFPGAADERLLRGELGLEVIDRAAEQRLHGVDHAGAAGGHAVDGIAGAVPQRDARGGALRVQPIEQVAGDFRVLFHGAAQQIGFRRVEHRAHDDEAVGMDSGWTPLGPVPLASDATGPAVLQDYHQVSGRATAVAIDPADATGNTVYIGGAQGGVWKSTNAAASLANNVTWTAVTDDQATLSIGSIAIQPGNSDPTQERDPGGHGRG